MLCLYFTTYPGLLQCCFCRNLLPFGGKSNQPEILLVYILDIQTPSFNNRHTNSAVVSQTIVFFYCDSSVMTCIIHHPPYFWSSLLHSPTPSSLHLPSVYSSLLPSTKGHGSLPPNLSPFGPTSLAPYFLVPSSFPPSSFTPI